MAFQGSTGESVVADWYDTETNDRASVVYTVCRAGVNKKKQRTLSLLEYLAHGSCGGGTI